MGSRISPVLSNIFMEHVEQLAISTFSTPPILWCRYLDDTFCILDKSQTESFHQHLNSVCKHIQFTKEVEFESSLPFLDVLVSRSGNNISTQIRKKPTHTDRYLPYTSHNPKHQKLAITHSLYNRISSHITDQTERQIARREVRQTLRTNGYPQWRIQKILVGGDNKNFKHKTSKIRMCCNQVRSQKFAMERLF